MLGNSSGGPAISVERAATAGDVDRLSSGAHVILFADQRTTEAPHMLQHVANSSATVASSSRVATVSGYSGLPALSGFEPLLAAGAAPLAGFIARPATGGTNGGVLVLSEALFDDRSEFTRRAEFPIFLKPVGGLIAGDKAAPLVMNADRACVDPLWPGMRHATLTFPSPLVEAGSSSTSPVSSSTTVMLKAATWQVRPAELLLLLAAAALIVESLLFSSRKIV